MVASLSWLHIRSFLGCSICYVKGVVSLLVDFERVDSDSKGVGLDSLLDWRSPVSGLGSLPVRSPVPIVKSLC